MLITLSTTLAAISLYCAASLYLILQMKRQQIPDQHWLRAFVGCALVMHGLSIYGLMFQGQGFHLNIAQASSLIFAVINLLVLISSLKKPLHNLFILLLPFSALAVTASLLLPTDGGSNTALDSGIISHILLSILAYSLLTIATLQALLLAFQNHHLHHRHPTGIVRLLPPLQTMESLLFELLWAGQIFLSLAIITGALFLQDIFAQHLAHKTAFSLAAWGIYAVLLWGHHKLGWRGNTASRWTLGGFVALMLAYFGSKLVLEVILQTA